MRSVSRTMFKRIRLLSIFWILGFSVARAQTENSPYSRYGLGDLVPTQNILTRGMGGISAGYNDGFTINSINPASYAKLQLTTFDLGVEVDNRTLKVTNPPRKFSAASPMISYIQLGIPLNQKRTWGMNFGLRPITRINYKLEKRENVNGDSILTLSEGTGGSHEVYVGTGFAIKNLSVGINVGYLFGSRDYSTRLSFLNDSVLFYKSNHEKQSNYHGIVMEAGIQYAAKLNKTTWLRFGAFGNLQQKLKASRDLITETFDYNTDGVFTIDSVYAEKNAKGDIEYPSSIGLGFLFEKQSKWMFGADFKSTNWDNYTFFNEKDEVQNSWSFHLGGQVIPNVASPKNYWNHVAYRAGFNYGKDYVKIDKDLHIRTFSVGVGLPLSLRRSYQSSQVSFINTSLEFGQRGNKQNSLRENFFRFSIGFSLSDLWFRKYQYQ